MLAVEKSARGVMQPAPKPSSRPPWKKNGRGGGRIRPERVDDVSAASLLAFVKDAVTPGTEVHLDGWRAYFGLRHAGYQHPVTGIDGGSSPAH